jgi:hypothetical protein
MKLFETSTFSLAVGFHLSSVKQTQRIPGSIPDELNWKIQSVALKTTSLIRQNVAMMSKDLAVFQMR